MNWEAIGAIGEVVGAAGVIASLIYLATQIRVTRDTDRLRSLESAYLTYNDVRKSLFEDGELSRIFLDGTDDPDSISGVDEFRYMAVLETLFLNGEAYWMKLSGSTDERLRIILGFLAYFRSTAGGSAFWEHPQSNNLTQDFRDTVEGYEFTNERLASGLQRGDA